MSCRMNASSFIRWLLLLASFLICCADLIPLAEYNALYDLYNATNGENWRWRTVEQAGYIWFANASQQPCDFPTWQGLTCNCYDLKTICNVVQIYLPEYNLDGTLPDSIGNFTELLELDFAINRLNGTIPDTIFQLTKARTVAMSSNNLTGTISDNFDLMPELIYLDFAGNHMTGTIPETLGYLLHLDQLLLFNNKMVGTIPELLYSATNLTQLSLNNNQFHGTLSESIGNLTLMTQLTLNENLFSGSIPESIGKLTQLYSLALQQNRLNGSIPQSLSNLTKLNDVAVNENQLTGSLPHRLGSDMIAIHDMKFYNNSLTGTLPVTLCHCFTIITLYFQNNFLQGTIPPCLGQLPAIAELVLFNNALTGPLPDNFTSAVMTNLLLYSNQLSGTLTTDMRSSLVAEYELFDNLFTGTIPYQIIRTESQFEQFELEDNFLTGGVPNELCSLSVLQQLDISSNILSGTLPSGLQNVKYLQILFVNKNVLTGSVTCFNNAIQFYLTNVELSNNQFTGSLPVEPFLIPTLESFSAVSNCFTGSIPSVVCGAHSLAALALDGLHTASSCRVPLLPLTASYGLNYRIPGSLPPCLFNLSSIQTLHVSGNGMQGSLPGDLVLSKSLLDLIISYNQFTGTIPDQIAEKLLINLDLSFNKLGGILLPSNATIPGNGSVYLQVNRLSGGIPEVLRDVETIDVLDGNLFQCNYKRKSLPKHDKQYTYYECGTSALEHALYVWIAFFCTLVALIVAVVVLKRATLERQLLGFINWCKKIGALFSKWMDVFLINKNEPEYVMQHVKIFGMFMDSLRYSFFFITLYIVLLLIPVNFSISHYYSMYLYKYGWNIASVFLSGLAPALTLLFFLLGFLIWFFVVFYYNLVSYITVKITNTESMISRESSMREKAKQNNYRHYLCLMAVALFNFVIVLGVNVSYVVITTRYNPEIVAATQVLLALFKLMWNDAVIRGLTQAAHNYSTRSTLGDDKKLSAAEERVLEGKYMTFNTYTMLFNIIFCPCLATSLVSSDCFYDVLVPPLSIESSYTYETCSTLQTLYQLKNYNCSSFVAVTKSTSYLPPFLYRYQCSSTLVTTYAVLYVYMFMLTAFGQPLLLTLLTVVGNRLQPTTRLYKVIQAILPKLYRATTLLLNDKTRFLYKDRFNLRTVTYLSIFTTFGVIFPPLAVIICVAIYIQTYFTQLSIGRVVDSMPPNSEERFVALEVFENDCVNTGDIFKQSIYVIGPVAASFYAFILFDVYGDQVGTYAALWLPLVMFILGCIIAYVFNHYVTGDPVDFRNLRILSHEIIELNNVSESQLHRPSVSISSDGSTVNNNVSRFTNYTMSASRHSDGSGVSGITNDSGKSSGGKKRKSEKKQPEEGRNNRLASLVRLTESMKGRNSTLSVGVREAEESEPEVHQHHLEDESNNNNGTSDSSKPDGTELVGTKQDDQV